MPEMKTGAQEREEFRNRVILAIKAMGIETKPCSWCDEPLIFMKTHAGKWQPVDMYLESHFANCPRAGAFRRARK
jgi:hypothetical protein